MNLKNWIAGSIFAVAVVGLVACGDDKSSDPGTSSPTSSSSSYTEPVVIPPTTENSPIVITNFGGTRTADSIIFNGNVVIDYDIAESDTVYLDSVVFTLSTADHYVLNDASFSMNSVSFAQRSMLDIRAELHPALSLLSFDACGDFVAYIVAYSGKFSSVDSLSFSKAQADYCPETIESSSSSAAAQITMTSWTTTLTTSATGAVGVDLDTRTDYSQSGLASVRDAIDLVIAYENKTLILVNAKEGSDYYASLSGATLFAKMGEETSGYDANNIPADPVYTSVFSYDANSLGNSIESPGYGEFWVVTTPSFDATTMKGFFVVMTGKPTEVVGDGQISVDLTIWGVP
jgi:hypothetical protein